MGETRWDVLTRFSAFNSGILNDRRLDVVVGEFRPRSRVCNSHVKARLSMRRFSKAVPARSEFSLTLMPPRHTTNLCGGNLRTHSPVTAQGTSRSYGQGDITRQEFDQDPNLMSQTSYLLWSFLVPHVLICMTRDCSRRAVGTEHKREDLKHYVYLRPAPTREIKG